MAEPVSLASDDHPLGVLWQTTLTAALLLDRNGTVVVANERATALLTDGDDSLAGQAVQSLPLSVSGVSLTDRCRSLETGATETASGTVSRSTAGAQTIEIGLRAEPVEGTERVLLLCRDNGTEETVARYESIVEAIDDGLYALNENLEFTFVNDSLCEMLETPRSELLGTNVMQFFERETDLVAAEQERTQTVVGDDRIGVIRAAVTNDLGARRLEARYRLHPETDGEFRGSVGVIRDVTERVERETTLERQRDELATLSQINELFLETVREVIRDPEASAARETVCIQLADSPFYRLAWIGERDSSGDAIVSRSIAGDESVDRITLSLDASSSPAVTALESGTVEVVAIDDERPPSWLAVEGDSIESVAAVPIRHGETVAGVLEIYATRSAQFSDRERTGFEVLGRAIGFAFQAARHRDMLSAGRTVEVTFDLSTTDLALVTLATSLECTIELDGYLPTDDRCLCYLTVSDAQPEAIRNGLQETETVVASRVLFDEEWGELEVELGGGTLLELLRSLGRSVSAATFTPEEATVSLEMTAGTDRRTVVNQVQSVVPGADLTAYHERERAVRPLGVPTGPRDELTEKQWETLQAAHRAGYFAWPRKSTAEEVAAALGIDRSTFHGHLRKAQRSVFSLLFDGPKR